MKWTRDFTLCCLAVVGIAVCVFPGYVSAEGGGIRFGKSTIEPGAKLGVEYNDNIYLDDEDEQDDIIFKFDPGIHFAYSGNPGNYFRTGYDLGLGMYMDNDENNFHSHSPFLSLGLRSPSGFYLNFDDNFNYSSDPYGSDNQYKQGVKTKRWDNSAELVTGWEFERLTLEGQYKYYTLGYMEDEDKWQNRLEHRLAAGLYFKLTHKTSAFAQFRYTIAEYDKQNDGILDANGKSYWNINNSEDYRLYEYFAGFRFKPGQKLTGEIKIGYGERDFENEYSPMLDSSGNPRKYEDQNTWIATWVAETSVVYRPVVRTQVNFDLKRAYKGSPDMYSSSYIDTLIAIALKQGLTEKISMNLGFDWNRADYFDEDPGQPRRYFDIYTLNAGLEWEIRRWLATGLEYEFESKNANDSLYEKEEYKNNKVTVYVDAQF